MNKDFWERIDKLEELAKKATQGKWSGYYGDKNEDYIDGAINNEYVHIAMVNKPNCENNTLFISSANPAMIMEMIAEMRMLKKEAEWLAEHMQAVCELNPSGICTESCPVSCSCDDFPFLKRHQDDGTTTNKKEWREAARKAVSEADNA